MTDNRSTDRYFLELIEYTLFQIDELKKSIEPEKILWSTQLATDEDLTHAIYSRIHSLIRRYTHGKNVSEPDRKLGSPMRLYTAWDALFNVLPTQKDFKELTEPVYRGRLDGSALGFVVQQIGSIRSELSVIVKMLKNAFD